jgi:hypothetical protein
MLQTLHSHIQIQPQNNSLLSGLPDLINTCLMHCLPHSGRQQQLLHLHTCCNNCDLMSASERQATAAAWQAAVLKNQS